MDYLFYFAIVVLGLIIWSFINDKKYQKNLKALRKGMGKLSKKIIMQIK